MSDDLREKVARVLADGQGEHGEGVWKFYLKDADAAITIIWNEAMEEAETALYSVARWDREIFDSLVQAADGTFVKVDEAAAAIRARKKP